MGKKNGLEKRKEGGGAGEKKAEVKSKEVKKVTCKNWISGRCQIAMKLENGVTFDRKR